MEKKSAIVIGAGFAGLSAATHLAQAGYSVQLLEKNESAGGRARQFKADGYTFDMGPSWYWMPDVFENYFQHFGKKVEDYYELERLDPSYRVVFEKLQTFDVPASLDKLKAKFEALEKGSSKALDQFLSESAFKYETGINNLVYKPSRSITEFLSIRLLYHMIRMNIFQSFDKYIRKFFKHPWLLQLMEFPVLFLGAVPKNTPALYSLMNYADIQLGTWYPKGGMHKIVEGMHQLAVDMGVKFHFNAEVKAFEFEADRIKSVSTKDQSFEADVYIAAADYHHVDQHLLPEKFRNYSAAYWDKRVMAPSSLLFYLGCDTKIPGLLHHNLFFDYPLGPHAHVIYEEPGWPENPLFYASVTSKTDPTVAPEKGENLFLLVPLAPDLEETEELREKYYHMIMDRLEKYTNFPIRKHVVYKRSYAHKDFKEDYHAFKGNAYGLANTLKQTAILKPSLKNKKLKNLYYTGQLTVPGPGVPPSLISGYVVANEINKEN